MRKKVLIQEVRDQEGRAIVHIVFSWRPLRLRGSKYEFKPQRRKERKDKI
jgi:hypothetical protein